MVRWIGAESFLASLPRVVVFCGGYGSGKTEVAVNFALHLASEGREVQLADLDIVNLYFRSREVREELASQGVRVLVPDEPLARADLPVILPEVKGAIERGDGVLVLDVGGDPVGARVLGGMADALLAAEYANLFVVNSRRPFTDTSEKTRRMIAEIGRVSGVPITGMVVNSHLIDDTTPEVVEEGIRLAEEVQKDTGISIAFVAVGQRVLEKSGTAKWRYPLMVLTRHMLKPWETAGD